ncbi:hypothetical protein EUX98_g830 [Antrodiella citrinella]|uniref:DUF2415 domain-containing protein n=1 Tax=Antrodiella citrinella TaxID=2447956 RepID=A0A4S4N307_9APHY|nr:hypothetical protein EUX98_g830 [Antrodiella citrinella]
MLDVTIYAQDVRLSRMPPTQQAAPILDFAWYPSATCRDAASFCFVASVRECPVKLLDASDGRLRASYKIVDHRERQIAPHSLAFNPSASKLYCGFEDAIEVFDLQYPGEGTRLHTTPNKRSRDGLKGKLTPDTMTFATDLSSGVYAAGSLNPSPAMSSNVALFSEATGETPLMFVGDDRDNGFGVRASAMQVMFNPARPYLLYASFRRHDAIYCWDVRGDVGVPVQKLVQPTNESHMQTGRGCDSTNQKLRFDIDLGGRFLSVGDHVGTISFFDLNSYEEGEYRGDQPTIISTPVMTYNAHTDAIGSVGFHPLKSLLLSVSGSRHFIEGLADVSEGEDSAEDGEEEEDDAEQFSLAQDQKNTRVSKSLVCPRPITLDNTVKLWQF